MISEAIARFQLSVWRPAQYGRQLDYAHTEKGSLARETFECDRLHEEIYNWHPGQEDVWGGIADSNLAGQLRDQFVEEFAPNLTPAQRSMERFREAVAKLRSHLSTAGQYEWGDLMQTVNHRGRASVNLRGNCALSLLHQMEWIVRTFGSVPGTSVTIR